MKRKIDELGRIVIPKEIRKSLKLNMGDSLEIYIEDNKISLRKYSSLKGYEEELFNIAKIINELTNSTILFIEEDKVEEFLINIISIDNRDETKNILFEIVDERLLNATGGVVQGMSGSPIIQDDYIIGAVTHVVVDDTTKGYGILITTMLEEAEN